MISQSEYTLSFWLIVAGLGWSDDIKISEVLVWIACVFVSILVHEFGHAGAARYFGAQNVSIELNGMGGLMISQANLDTKKRIIELICGPLAGFILLFLAILARKFTALASMHHLILFALIQLAHINLYWGLLNLLPIYPMDGGQIMNEILRSRKPWEGMEKTYKISMIISIAVAAIFLFPLVFSWFSDRESNWFPVLIFLAFALMNYHMLKGRFSNNNQKSAETKPRYSWERDPDWWKK